MGITNLSITSISQPSNVITLVAAVTVDARGANANSFNFRLTYPTEDPTYNAFVTPSTQSPRDSTEYSNFTLTVTFSLAEFAGLYTIDQTATYLVNYSGNFATSQNYTYVNPNSFVFNSFTVLQSSIYEIVATATYTAVLETGSVQASDFTYTVVIDSTPYTYTTATTGFNPTVTSTSFIITFTSTYFNDLFQDGVLQAHTLNFTKPPPSSLDVTTTPPVEFTYSQTTNMTITISSIVLDTDPTYVLASFVYTFSGFTPTNTNLIYKVRGDTDLAPENVTWTINNSTKFGSARFSTGSTQTASIYVQLASFTNQIRYVATSGSPVGPFFSNTVNTVYTIANSNNIGITKPVTVISISANKTAILPPVAKVPGTLYHFKISTADAYTCKIYPFLTAPFTPTLRTYLYTTSGPAFDSFIESANYYLFDSTTTLNTLTLASNGTNWWILNNYLNSLTIGVLSSAPTLYVEEVNETTAFQYTYLNSGVSYTKILLKAMSYSYLKYIFITNSDSSTNTFIIYTPNGAPLETLGGTSGEYNYLTFTLNSGKVAGIVLTYINGIYYIISAAINPSISAISPFLDTSSTLSTTLSFLQNQSYYEIPYLPSFNYVQAKLLIMKGLTTPISIRGGDIVLFQLESVAVSAFSLPVNSAVWFIGIKSSSSEQSYLPVSYYSPPA